MKTTSTRFSFVTKFILVWFFAITMAMQLRAQISVSGGSGLSATYTSLTKSTGLFAALNANSQTGNNITVTITGDVTNEDGSTALNTGSWASLTISPSGARTISGSVNGALIDFNSADNVTINGLNSGGNSLTISNINTAATNGYSSAVRFINDATANTITNCTLSAAGTNTSTGVVLFSTGTSTGNDGNTISNCNITTSSIGNLSNGIASIGTSTSVDNSGNTISGNNIYDYFKADSTNSGIKIGANNATWTISNNKLYQTASRQNNNQTVTFFGINLNTAGLGDGFSVSGNTIGYASSTGTGTYTMPWAVTTNSFYKFQAIYVSVGTTNTTNISGNTIANISIQSQVSGAQGNVATGGVLTGIYVAAGALNITNNTIGATSGTGSLTATVGGLGTGSTVNNIGGVVGVFIAGNTSSNITLDGNTIASLNTVDSNKAKPTATVGLYVSAAVNSLTVKNNTFGNTTANSFLSGQIASGSTLNSIVAGIYASSLATVSFDCYGNTFQNFTAVGSGTAGFARGIQLPTSGSPTYNIYNNTIKNITANNTNTSTVSGLVSVQGLNVSTSGVAAVVSVYGNTIYNLSNTNTVPNSALFTVAGISIATGATTPRIFKNKIYGLANAATGTTTTAPPVAAGIIIWAATTSDSIYNNMISLGTGQTSNTCFVGIWAPFGFLSPVPTTSYFYHNTVNIAGTVSGVGTLPSFCFLRAPFSQSSTGNVTIKNNIFTNSRGGSGVHYAIGDNYPTASGVATTGWVSNYNILNAPANVGWHNGGLNFTSWKSTMTSDANSSNGSTVNYVDGATDLHMASSMGSTANLVESAGDPALGITADYDGETRPGTTNVNGGGIIADLGADEFDGKYTSTCSLSGYTPSTNATKTNIASYSVNNLDTFTLSSLLTATGIIPNIFY